MRTHRSRRHRVPAVTAGVLLVATMLLTAAPTSGAAATDGGWSIVDPAAVGMDAGTLAGARDYAFASGRNTQGVVVVRGGHIASEWYAPGEGPRSWAASWSEAKSVIGILIGIAIDEGKIAGVDQPMTTWFPDWKGTPKAAITLRDVLEMASGLKSNEDYNPAHAGSSDVIKMGLSSNELAYSESRPLAAKPGTVFNYSSADAMLLSRVIEVATGMSAAQFAQVKLFDPLGIHQVEWWSDAAGHTLTYCCMDTTTRDFARIGLLYLNDGNWNGHQIVSKSWVHESLTPTAVSKGEYGYLFWFIDVPGISDPVPMMDGFDGQFVYMIRSLDLVVARNGDYVKSACPPVADPGLFGRYPPSNLVPGAGTRPPSSWNDAAFLKPIIDSVSASPGTTVYPAAEPTPTSRDPDGQTMVPCADAAKPPAGADNQPPKAQPVKSEPATPVRREPTFTG